MLWLNRQRWAPAWGRKCGAPPKPVAKQSVVRATENFISNGHRSLLQLFPSSPNRAKRKISLEPVQPSHRIASRLVKKRKRSTRRYTTTWSDTFNSSMRLRCGDCRSHRQRRSAITVNWLWSSAASTLRFICHKVCGTHCRPGQDRQRRNEISWMW